MSPSQVPGVKQALQHNLGLGGACVVAAYKKANSNPPIRALPSDPTILQAWEKEGANLLGLDAWSIHLYVASHSGCPFSRRPTLMMASSKM